LHDKSLATTHAIFVNLIIPLHHQHVHTYSENGPQNCTM